MQWPQALSRNKTYTTPSYAQEPQPEERLDTLDWVERFGEVRGYGRVDSRPLYSTQAAPQSEPRFPQTISLCGNLVSEPSAEALHSARARREMTPVLSEFFDYVDREFKRGAFRGVDAFIASLAVERLASPVRIGIARITSPARRELTSWNDFVRRAADAYRKEGRDPAIPLRGLLDELG